MPARTIRCASHGSAFATFVCKHVADGEGLGFVFDDTSAEPWPDAVCTACAEEPPWSEQTSRERIHLLCSRCWDAAFERNTSKPAVDERSWFRGVAERALRKQDEWRRAFQVDSFKRYDYSFEAGRAWLAFGDGASFPVRCDAHVIGSLSSTSDTWLWGWANDYWEARLTEAVVRVKRRGEREGVRSLARSGFEADETDAWDLACAVLDTMPDVDGVYRAPGEVSLFLAVTGTRWVG